MMQEYHDGMRLQSGRADLRAEELKKEIDTFILKVNERITSNNESANEFMNLVSAAISDQERQAMSLLDVLAKYKRRIQKLQESDCAGGDSQLAAVLSTIRNDVLQRYAALTSSQQIDMKVFLNYVWKICKCQQCKQSFEQADHCRAPIAEPVVTPHIDMYTPSTSPASDATVKRPAVHFSMSFGEFGSSPGRFQEPCSLDYDRHSGHLYVADANNCAVYVFDVATGRYLHSLRPKGSDFLFPNNVRVCPRTRNVIVTERKPNNRVFVFTRDAATVGSFGQGLLKNPRGLAVDTNGDIFVLQSPGRCAQDFTSAALAHRDAADKCITVYDRDGRFKDQFPLDCTDFPIKICVDAQRRDIYVADNRKHRIEVFDQGTGALKRQLPRVAVMDGGQSDERLINYPVGIMLSSDRGDIVVCDNHRNFNITVMDVEDGCCIRTAVRSTMKHSTIFDCTLVDNDTVAMASKNHKIYLYRFRNGPSVL